MYSHEDRSYLLFRVGIRHIICLFNTMLPFIEVYSRHNNILTLYCQKSTNIMSN